MSVPYSRRSFLAAGVAVALGGCVEGGDDGSDTGGDDDSGATDGSTGESNSDDTSSDQETKTPEGETSTDTSETDEESPEEQVARLPDQHPLSDALVELILADDREVFAAEHDLTVRDGTVQVEIRLVEGGTPPEKYLPEDRTAYGNKVIAYVDIDSLVDLALDENVKRIFRRISPKPDDGKR